MTSFKEKTMEIIDFHTHPFISHEENICIYKEDAFDRTISPAKDLRRCQISTFLGSVICKAGEGFAPISTSNVLARKLCRISGGAYIPGFQIDARFVDESIKEIEKARAGNIKLIGELVPYIYGWDYSDEGFEKILQYTDRLDMVYSLHSTDILKMRELALRHKNTIFVFAHPGEADRLKLHIETMKMCENVFLDLSGTGLFRYGMLKHLVNQVGAERILFGTDYPICNPAMYIAAVLYERLSENDMDLIFAGNAKRILQL